MIVFEFERLGKVRLETKWGTFVWLIELDVNIIVKLENFNSFLYRVVLGGFRELLIRNLLKGET